MRYLNNVVINMISLSLLLISTFLRRDESCGMVGFLGRYGVLGRGEGEERYVLTYAE
jgi:hypothetical protein